MKKKLTNILKSFDKEGLELPHLNHHTNLDHINIKLILKELHSSLAGHKTASFNIAHKKEKVEILQAAIGDVEGLLDEPVYYELGRELYDKKNYHAAIECFERALRTGGIEIDQIVNALYLQGLSFYTLNKYPQAAGRFHKVIFIKDHIKEEYPTNTKMIKKDYPETLPSLYYKGQSLYALKKFKGAGDCFKDVEKDLLTPYAIRASLYKGFCAESLENYDEAINSFRDVIDPKSKYNKSDSVTPEIVSMAEKSLKTLLIKIGDWKTLEEVFKVSENIEMSDGTGYTLLMQATEQHNNKIVMELLKCKANPTKQDMFGHTPLSIALKEKEENLTLSFIKTLICMSDEQNHNIHKFKKMVSHHKKFEDVFKYIYKHPSILTSLGFSKKAAQVCLEEARNLENDSDSEASSSESEVLGGLTEDFDSFNIQA